MVTQVISELAMRTGIVYNLWNIHLSFTAVTYANSDRPRVV